MSKLEVTNQHGIQDRLIVLKHNARSMAAVSDELRENALDFNRKRALAGEDVHGVNFAPLKPRTLETRDGTGPPLAPQGASADIVTKCRVKVEFSEGVAVLVKTWPGVGWLKHAITGNSHTPARDPTGFSVEEKAKFKDIVGRHLSKKTK